LSSAEKKLELQDEKISEIDKLREENNVCFKINDFVIGFAN
jgi:hypothetical protein